VDIDAYCLDKRHGNRLLGFRRIGRSQHGSVDAPFYGCSIHLIVAIATGWLD